MWYGWDIIKGNYFMNERELLNHVFAEIIDNLKKLEPEKDKEGKPIQRTALDYSTELLCKSSIRLCSASEMVSTKIGVAINKDE